MNDTTQEAIKPAQMVEEYIALRDGKKKAEDVFEEWCKANFGTRMLELEGHLLATLNTLGLDSLASPSGTAYKLVTTSVTVADAREFRRHVIGLEDWDLIDWRANKTAINDKVEKGEDLPPGINRTTFVKVGIRRK